MNDTGRQVVWLDFTLGRLPCLPPKMVVRVQKVIGHFLVVVVGVVLHLGWPDDKRGAPLFRFRSINDDETTGGQYQLVPTKESTKTHRAAGGQFLIANKCAGSEATQATRRAQATSVSGEGRASKHRGIS